MERRNDMATDRNTGSDEFLVLSDPDGNWYAIPRQTVERHRVTGELKEQVDQVLGQDVEGFSMYQQFLSQQQAGSHQADRRREAAEARMAASAGREDTEDTNASTPASAGVRGMITGVWRSLPFLKPASTNP
jgi:hypothetical protein